MAARKTIAQLSREDILGMSYAEIREMLASVGVGLDEAVIQDAVDAAYARVNRVIASGLRAPDDATTEMLGRAVENAFNDAVRRQIKAAVRQTRLTALTGGAPTQPLIWVATMVNTCRSCLDRHGEVKTLADWQALGMPGDPVLICDGNCNCQLMPVPAQPGADPYGDFLRRLGEKVDVDLGLF